MNITNHVLKDVRGFLHLDKESDVFDSEIIPHILSSLGKLSQNGIGVSRVVDDTTIWTDIIDGEMIVKPDVFSMVPLFIMMSTKILFDPPPPSAIEYHKQNIDELLWRLRLEYDVRGGDESEGVK